MSSVINSRISVGWRGACFVLCTGMLLLLVGCWDSRELNQRAIITAMGIDKGQQHRYEVSFQVIVADEIAGDKARGSAPVVIYREEGDTIFETVRKASRKVARQVSLSHVKAVVISEEVARNGIGYTLDFLERDAETRLTIEMYIARSNRAQDVLSTMTSIDRIPANDITGKQEMVMRKYGETFTVQIDQVIRDLSSKEGGALIPGIRLSGDLKKADTNANVSNIKPKAILHIQGMAMFKGDKLVDWMDGKEGIGLSILHNKLKSTITTLPYKNRPESITIETIYIKRSITASMIEGKPAFTISAEQSGGIGEANSPLNLESSAVIEELQKEWSADTENTIKRTIQTAKASQADVLGFGRVLERENPQAWKQLSGRWSNVFVESTVHIHVTSVLQNTHTRKNPYLTH